MTALGEYPALLEFGSSHVGEIRRAIFAGWNHAESLIWEIESEQGQRAFLKSHRQPAKFKQELAAYREWLPHLPNVTPQLLAFKPEPPLALLLSKVEGAVFENANVTAETEQAVYRKAGAFLAAMHALPYEDTDICAAEALRNRLLAWSTRAAGHVSASELDWVQGRVTEALPAVRRLRRVPCHRDYHPRNWLVDETGALSVIDFEHARPDLFLMDIERLWSRQWDGRPHLSDSFWDGYGRALDSDEEELLSRCAALAAMSTIAWAREHGDKHFESHGRQVLGRLMRR